MSCSIPSLHDGPSPLRLSEVMEQAWAAGTFWYTLALSSPTGLFSLFYKHIHPILTKQKSSDIGPVMPFYWTRDAPRFVLTKVADKEKYDRDLREAFTATSDDEDSSAP